MNLQITKQRNLMQQAIIYYNDIATLKCYFGTNDPLVNVKIEMLQKQYAETVTELAKLLMEAVEPLTKNEYYKSIGL